MKFKSLLAFVLLASAFTSHGTIIADDVFRHANGNMSSKRIFDARNTNREQGRWRENARATRLPPMTWRTRRSASINSFFRLPGEFEKQQYLLLSCGELNSDHTVTITDIIAEVRHHVHVVVLFANVDQRSTVMKSLNRRAVSTENVSFVRIVHDTKWVRDFGPTVLHNGAQTVVVDWQYDQGRPNDDAVPSDLAFMTNTLCEQTQLYLEGGNLLSNGHGLCVTTTAVTEKNTEYDYDHEKIYDLMRRTVRAERLIVLEPLVGEDTGHVDMFMTFTGPNSVVVGEYSQLEDPENAALLDRNAARLASIRTRMGPLCVTRVPMGKRHDGLWRTYTNCIYANGILLVPNYQDGDEIRSQKAVSVYRRLLPGWHIVSINAQHLIESGGALHCSSLNVPSLSEPLVADRLWDGYQPRSLVRDDVYAEQLHRW